MARIGFLVPEFPGQTHAFFIRESRELAKRGFDTRLISTRAPVDDNSIARHAWAQEAAADTRYLFPMQLSEILGAFGEILSAGPSSWMKCLRHIFGASDMRFGERLRMFPMWLAGAHLKRICAQDGLRHTHVHSCANAANVAMFARLMKGPSYSLTLHGPMQDYGTNQANKWRHANFCIVITRELWDEVHTKLEGTPLPPMYLAPMGVNLENFKRSRPYTRPEPGGLVRLVSCGRLNYVKAHDDLLRVVAKLREKGINARLHICGATDSQSNSNDYHASLLALQEELGLQEAVEFLGSVSEERVRDELESAHVFCLASLKEPLGVATMEAMAMEMPCVVTESPGVCEMVDSGVDGILVPPRSPDAFVEAIEKLLADPEYAAQLAEAGRKKIQAKFHSGVSAEKIAEGVRQHGDS